MGHEQKQGRPEREGGGGGGGNRGKQGQNEKVQSWTEVIVTPTPFSEFSVAT